MASTTKNKAVVEFEANTKAFNAGLKQANSALTELRSELRLNKTEAQGAGDSMENLANRQKILTSEIEAQQQKIGLLTDRLDEARQAFGDGSIMVQKLQTQLNNASSAQAKMQQELSATNAALDEMEQASAQASSAMGRLESDISSQEAELKQLKTAYSQVALEQGESSDEARQLASQIQRTSSELQDNRTKLQQAESAADKFDRTLDTLGDTAQDTGKDFDAMDVALGDFASDMAQNALSSIASLEEETRQYRLEQGKLDAQLINSGKVTKDQIDYVGNLTDEYIGFYRLTGDETLASTAAANMMAMGLSVGQTNDLLEAGSGIWAQYGDSIPLDGLMESVNETANTAVVTGNLADALNWATNANIDLGTAMGGNTAAQQAYNKAKADGMSNEDAFNEALKACTTEQERQQLIVDTLSGAYGDLGETYNDLTKNAQNANQAQAWLTEAQAGLADAIAPVTTQFQYLIGDALMWLTDNLPTVTSFVTGFAIAVGGLMIVQQVNTGFAALSGVMKGISGVFTLLTSPLGLVVAGIAALVTGFMLAYQNSEPFRNAINELVGVFQETFGPALSTVGNLISQGLTAALQFLSTFLETVIVPGIQTFTAFLQESVFPVLQQWGDFFVANIIPALQQMWEWFSVNILPILQMFGDFIINSVLPVLGQLASWLINTAGQALSDFWNWFSTKILPILQDFWNFVQANVLPVLSDLANWITGTVAPALSDFWDWFSGNIIPILQSFWDFVSANILPVLGDLAEFVLGTVVPALKSLWGFFQDNILPILEQVGGAIEDVAGFFKDLGDTAGRIIEDMKGTVQDGLDRISGFFSGVKLELPKIKLPHFSISGSFSLNPPSIPHIGVSWYAQGGILEQPTIFGASGSNLLAGGEAGPEAVAPISDLLGYMMEALDAKFGQSDTGALVDAIEALADRVISIEINGKQLARATASDNDRASGSRQKLINRGVSLA